MKQPTSDILKPLKKHKLVAEPKTEENPSSQDSQAGPVPRITNETVASHREDVLKSARKYIYPLKHSKHRIILISTSLVIVAVVGFFGYCTLALYKFGSYSTFLYRVTEIIPFPIARVGGHFVAYENYLFELNHYIHYYQTQQKLNFASPAGAQQLEDYRQRALDKVINDAYVKELAQKNNVTVTDQEVNEQVSIVRQENRLGNNQAEFEDVLKTYWGWSVDDFKRELKTQLLDQNLVSALDTGTHQRAQTALAAVQGGQDFAAAAAQYSDDQTTKANGGQYGFLISENDVNVPPQVVSALFALKAGQITGIINTGYSLEIDKVLSIQGSQIQAAHIVFNFKDINTYLTPLKDQQKATTYIKTS
ncbi:MAG TPA: peptidylprolyl isomerase [Candidatus Saccharimonadales bacterium]|nr:peptidylprolyl isomerase [Candidatus Saccharimonadales bacterium]